MNSKLLINTVLSLTFLSSAMPAFAAEKIGSFDILLSPTEVFKDQGHALKTIQDRDEFGFTHENESYAIVAKRSDGTVVTVIRQPSLMTEGKFFTMGYFFNCHKKTDIPMVFEDANELTDLLKTAPSTFAEHVKQDKTATNFEDDMPIHDYYLLSCPSK